jgi:hypothetical protein
LLEPFSQAMVVFVLPLTLLTLAVVLIKTRHTEKKRDT